MRSWGVLPIFRTAAGQEHHVISDRPFQALALWLWAEPNTMLGSLFVEGVGNVFALRHPGTSKATYVEHGIGAELFAAPGLFVAMKNAVEPSSTWPWRLSKQLGKAWLELAEHCWGDGLPEVGKRPAGTRFEIRVNAGVVRAGAWVGRTDFDPRDEIGRDPTRLSVDFAAWGRSQSPLELPGEAPEVTEDRDGQVDVASELARLGLVDVDVKAFQDGSSLLIVRVQTSEVVRVLSDVPDNALAAFNPARNDGSRKE